LILPALGAALALTSLAMIFQSRLHRLGQQLRTTEPGRFKMLQAPLTVVAGALLGFLVTLTSVGAGALGVVMLVYLYPFRLTPPKLVGTDIAHARPLTLIAGLGHEPGQRRFPAVGALSSVDSGHHHRFANDPARRSALRAQCHRGGTSDRRRQTAAALTAAGALRLVPMSRRYAGAAAAAACP
jgi:hypothetical protein